MSGRSARPVDRAPPQARLNFRVATRRLDDGTDICPRSAPPAAIASKASPPYMAIHCRYSCSPAAASLDLPADQMNDAGEIGMTFTPRIVHPVELRSLCTQWRNRTDRRCRLLSELEIFEHQGG